MITDLAAMAGIGHLSDTGQAGRDEPNQDSYSLPARVSARLASKGWLFCVADGSSSNEGEERGSQIAVNLIQQTYYRDRATDIGQRLKHAVETANREIFERSGGVLFNDLSVSLVCAVVTRTGITVTHAGDCRAYLVTPQQIRCLTQDHVIIEQPDSASGEDPDQPKASPVRLVTLSVGGMPTIDLDCKTFAFQPDARIVLCTQGLTNIVGDEELREIAGRDAPADAARRLVALANERGGRENVTVVVVDPSLLLVETTPAPRPSGPVRITWLIRVGIAAVLLAGAAVAIGSSGIFRLAASSADNLNAITSSPQTPSASALSVERATAVPTAITPATTPTLTPTPTPPPTDTPTSMPTPVPPPTDTPVADTPAPTATSIRQRASTPAPPTAVPLRYPAIGLREPQDNQQVTGVAATLEFESITLLGSDHYEVYYRREGNAAWDGKCAPVSSGSCILPFGRVQQRYGTFEWTAVVVDANGFVVSGIPDVRRFQWAVSVDSSEPRPPGCIPRPTNRC